MEEKLVDGYNENIDEEVKIVSESKNKCSSCIAYLVLFSIFFTINIEIATYFVYYKYTNPNKKMFLWMIVFVINIKWVKLNK